MPDCFTVEIDLGNDAMRLPEHVALALHALAEQLVLDQSITFEEYDVRAARDINGNTVGAWTIA